ncbi:hypothetical protein CUMW_204370 [Citrus unshiu]|uniref:Splicing factor subunit n=1 Tax=Citrus unshiu TaxID=55188 RepID=A0A2H5Q7X7_CITUN|nr:hypothetical protein CUMW_204370 [Citrus unshiu]
MKFSLAYDLRTGSEESLSSEETSLLPSGLQPVVIPSKGSFTLSLTLSQQKPKPTLPLPSLPFKGADAAASSRSRFASSFQLLSSLLLLPPASFAVVSRTGTLRMQASDRFNINSQLEHLQAKYVGTGHADLNRFEWAVNIQRDSYASYVGHYPILAYFSIAENESIGREHYNFMQKMLLPCGLPPEREDD